MTHVLLGDDDQGRAAELVIRDLHKLRGGAHDTRRQRKSEHGVRGLGTDKHELRDGCFRVELQSFRLHFAGGLFHDPLMGDVEGARHAGLFWLHRKLRLVPVGGNLERKSLGGKAMWRGCLAGGLAMFTVEKRRRAIWGSLSGDVNLITSGYVLQVRIVCYERGEDGSNNCLFAAMTRPQTTNGCVQPKVLTKDSKKLPIAAKNYSLAQTS